MKIKLKKYFKSSVLVNPEKAKSLYDRLRKIMKKEKEVVLDFEGIKAITFVFLYVLFTNLWNEHGKDLKNRLTINNAQENLLEQMMYLRKNYKTLQAKFLGTHQNFEISYIS
nr:STAS-like domain-containing protein [uncultured Cetobacterium sp.]